MQIFFGSRTAQRNFKGAGKKVDNGSAAGNRRWGIELEGVKASKKAPQQELTFGVAA